MSLNAPLGGLAQKGTALKVTAETELQSPDSGLAAAFTTPAQNENTPCLTVFSSLQGSKLFVSNF